jgi:hypothetical protein
MESENQNIVPNNTQPEAKGTSKKNLYIVIGVVIVLVLGKFALGGMTHTIPGVDLQKGIGGATTFTTEQGSVTVGGTQKLPDNWPSDAPTYGNAQIQSAIAANPQEGHQQSAVVFTTTDSVQAITDFYKKELVTEGWKVGGVMTSPSGTVVAATKDTRSFGAYIVESGDGKVTVTASVSTK